MVYQVDFFPVGEGSRSGDQSSTVGSGVRVRRWSSTSASVWTTHVDVVVSTHPDTDHSCGLAPVLEELKVGQLWMHKPWEHTYDISKMFQDGRVTDMSVAEGIGKSLKNVRYLEKLPTKKGISIVEPFTGLQDVTQSLTVI